MNCLYSLCRLALSLEIRLAQSNSGNDIVERAAQSCEPCAAAGQCQVDQTQTTAVIVTTTLRDREGLQRHLPMDRRMPLVEIAQAHFLSGKAYAIRASPGGVIMK